jgi:hypothetical protein
MLGGQAQGIEQEENPVYTELRDKIISLVNEKQPFNSALFDNITIEKLRLKANYGPDKDKSLIWWLTWAVLNGRPEGFELALLKFEKEFLLADVLQQAENEPNSGISPLLLLAHAAKFRPRLFNWAWNKWGEQISTKDLRSKAEYGSLKNISLVHAMILAANENKIKREIIEKIIREIPDICNKDDLSCKPLEEPSLEEFIQHIISQNSDWGVKLKRIMSVRNTFFESLANLTSHSNASDFTKLEQAAQAAYNEGVRRALEDVDSVISIISSAQKSDWSVVFRLLIKNATNILIINESLYSILLRLAKRQMNLLAMHQINICFKKDKLYNQDDFSAEFESLKRYDSRFKADASFVSHALVKRDAANKPYMAHQYLFASDPKDALPIAKLHNIQCLTNNNKPMFEATTQTNQKMVSTEHFTIELQTKVGADFVCESYDLVLFVPKNDRGHEQGVFSLERFPFFKPDAPMSAQCSDDKLDEECPTVRLGERNISIDDMHLRQSYHNQHKLKERDQEGISRTLHGKALDLYKEFFLFFSAFFTEKMMQVAKKSAEGLSHFAPEVLHAIARQFHRPSESHYDIKNLAIAPKWVNSLMMVIESVIRWHAIHAPFSHLSLKTMFKTFPMRHVLEEGKIEASMKNELCEVKISKELQPYQKFPTFPRKSDITQTTFALNSLLHGVVSQPVTLIFSEMQRKLPHYEHPSQIGVQTTHETPMLKPPI